MRNYNMETKWVNEKSYLLRINFIIFCLVINFII